MKKSQTDVRTQGRSWIATINCKNGEEEFEKAKLYCLYAIGQVELGDTTGNEHLQAVFHFQVNWRLNRLKKIWPKGHFEIVKSMVDAIEYCSKNDTRLRGPWSFGVDPITRQKSNWSITVKEARDRSEEELQQLSCYQYINVKKALQLIPSSAQSSDTLRGLWIHGPPGSGKSKFAFESYPDAYIKAQNKWFCGYKGEKTIILDDLDCLNDKEMGHYLKRWSDHYKCTGEIKGGITGLSHSLFIVTSNYVPEELWPSDQMLQQAIRRRFQFKIMN